MTFYVIHDFHDLSFDVTFEKMMMTKDKSTMRELDVLALKNSWG